MDFHADALKRISDRLGWKRDPKGRLYALIDSAAGQRTLASAKSVSELFLERGILVNPRVNKDVFSGVAQVKSFLSRKNGMPDLYIFSCCTEMIREFKSYFWGENDSPVKRDDHAMDELRYFLMTRPRAAEKIGTEISEITKDKDRLIRRLRRGVRA